MNEQHNLSPEEKLLRLIKKPNAGQPQSGSDNAGSGISHTKGVEPSFEKVTPAAPERKKDLSGICASFLTSATLNRLIIYGSIIVVSLSAYDIYARMPQMPQLTQRTVAAPEDTQSKEDRQPLAYYLSPVQSRSLFKLKEKPREQKKFVPAGPSFQERVKNYHLLGIVSGENPQAIIEDQKTRQSYFLHEGEYLNDMLVFEIHPDRVVLELNGEHISLFL